MDLDSFCEQYHYDPGSVGRNLAGVDWTGTDPDETLVGATLDGATLDDADLSSRFLIWVRAVGASAAGVDLAWSTCNGASFRRADLREASFRNAALSGIDLAETDLRGAEFEGAALTAATLDGADAARARMPGCWLREASLDGATVQEATLSGAYLGRASLAGADLRGADLSGAWLRDADLTGADLRGADLSGADLGEARLADARVDPEQLQTAAVRAGATLPEGVTVPGDEGTTDRLPADEYLVDGERTVGEWVVDLLVDRGVDRASIEGLSRSAIDDREAELGVALPAAYRSFLRHCGRSAPGSGLEGSHGSLCGEDPVRKHRVARRVEPTGPSSRALAFAFEPHDVVVYGHLSYSREFVDARWGPDPPVYTQTTGESPRRAADSFTDLVRERIEDDGD